MWSKNAGKSGKDIINNLIVSSNDSCTCSDRRTSMRAVIQTETCIRHLVTLGIHTSERESVCVTVVVMTSLIQY